MCARGDAHASSRRLRAFVPAPCVVGTQLPFSARALQRIVMGSAVDLNVDAAGRLLIPAELRAFCSLEKDVALVGMGEHFELWNAEKLRAQEEAALEGLAAAAADFHF